MSEKIKPYVPSDEEVKKAKDTMTLTQRDMSIVREKHVVEMDEHEQKSKRGFMTEEGAEKYKQELIKRLTPLIGKYVEFVYESYGVDRPIGIVKNISEHSVVIERPHKGECELELVHIKQSIDVDIEIRKLLTEEK